MKTSVLNAVLPAEPPASPTVKVQVEVVPGAIVETEVPEIMRERFVAVKLAPIAGRPGIYRVVPRDYRALVPVTEDLGERMGWGLERRQILALGVAGLINCYRATTGATLVDPVSVWEHIDNTRISEAREFWTPERVASYRDAQEFVRATGIVDAGRRRDADAIPNHLEFDFSGPE